MRGAAPKKVVRAAKESPEIVNDDLSVTVVDGFVVCKAHKVEVCPTCGFDFTSDNDIFRGRKKHQARILMPSTEISKQVEEVKKKGNDAFTRKSWDEAVMNYSKAIELSETRPSWERGLYEIVKKESAVLYCNRAAAYLEKGSFHDALLDCIVVLGICPEWAKAHFRAGCAYQGLGKLPEARDALVMCINLEPSNTDALERLQVVKQSLDAARAGDSSATEWPSAGSARSASPPSIPSAVFV
mmetsp:Transcript_17610/g.30320  ORF Transcript_17610/g.30320 Transcript_17610/m.30320 type:complete len:242 (-) Transcript_17610:132-857(-)|eukprot:CAMPEP_0196656244 /NCGR_PEP_ID=MMETSP1086-20130531/14540_1 /TAXON_ID=77921 /ORGANISM="Cyanoptyche  gloeocystis , Strain SAG4.97" /LENGTH=241 /DNA_ID=CAMNT_0041988903 /DNA_START=90 /DNA_END=815 /DNA_ORIENTATION=+